MSNPTLVIPSTVAGVSSDIQVGPTRYAPVNGVTTLPAEVVQYLNGFNPLDLPGLITYVQTLSNNGGGVVNTTLAGLRSLEDPTTLLRYYTLDAGQEGVWKYDQFDTTSNDDTGLTLVSATGKRYKRELLDYVDLSWFGVSRATGPVAEADDISVVVQAIMVLLKQKNLTGKYIRIAAGTYRWQTRVITQPYKLDLRCTDGEAVLQDMGNGTLWISTTTDNCFFQNIVFQGQRGTPVVDPSLVTFDNINSYIAQFNAVSHVTLSSIATFHGCRFLNGRGNGIAIDGNIGIRNEIFSTGSNSSLSVFRDCQFAGNRGCGMYVEGVDANQILFEHYDCRDNDLIGMWDASFLGCQFVNSGHTNNNRLGHHAFTDPNNRSYMSGTYEEDGSPASYFTGRYTVAGCRLTGNPVAGGMGMLIGGEGVSKVNTGELNFYATGGKGFSWQGAGDAAYQLTQSLVEGLDNQTHTRWLATGGEYYMGEMFQENVTLQARGSGYKRRADKPGFAFPRLYMGPRYNVEVYAESMTHPSLNGETWTIGDRVRLAPYSSTRPEYYICLSGGFMGTDQLIAGVTAYINPNDGGQPTLSSVSGINVGEFLRFGPTVAQVLAIDPVTRKLQVEGFVQAVGQTVAVSRAAATFRAKGDMYGPVASRPTLTLLDKGIRYSASDEASEFRWNGTSWVTI